MNKQDWITLIFYIILIVGSVIVCKWLFELIYYSDLPDWLKYMLLK